MVGLGNPGDRYVGTRHNVGFEVIEALARRGGVGGSVRVDRLDCRALTGRVRIAGLPVLLAKPQTYMNLSGESAKGLALKYGVPLERMLVVSDDVALPVGRIRLRPSGSAGGQKGLQNILEVFKTNAIPRLRVGVQGETRRPGDDLADYVLDRFSKAERSLVDESIADAAEAVTTFLSEGIDKAMNRFNGAPEEVPAG